MKLLHRVAIFLALFVSFAVLHTELAFGFGSIANFVTLGLLVVVAVLFLFAAIKRKWAPVIYGVVLFLSLVSGSQVGMYASDFRKKTVERDAVSIIEALEKFHRSTGGYPGNLQELEPVWLARVPDARIGFFVREEFKYWVHSGNDAFSLRYEQPYFLWREYDSTKQEWCTRD